MAQSGGRDAAVQGTLMLKVKASQYRITFRWEGHDAHDICCEDYH